MMTQLFQMDGCILAEFLYEVRRATLARAGQNDRHHWYTAAGNQHQVWPPCYLWRNTPNSHQRARVARQDLRPQACGDARRHRIV